MTVGRSMNDVTEPSSLQPMTLREAREQAGLHVVALAAMLKVSVRKLEALESGRYEELPDMTFARGLAASVCRVLKVDAGPVLASLPQTAEVRLGQDEGDLNTPFPTGQQAFSGAVRGLFKPSSGSHLRPVLIALLLLGAAAGVWLGLPAIEGVGSVADNTEVVPPAQGNVAPAPAENPAVVAAPVVEPVPVATVAVPAAVVLPAPVADQSNQAAPAVQGGTPLLQLRARQATWVQVRGTNGKILLERNLPAGEAAEVVDEGPLAVVVGRAGDVDVLVRGQSMDIQSYSRNNVARFEVK